MVTLKRKEKRGKKHLNGSETPSAVTREVLRELSQMARPTQRLDIVPWLEKHRRLSPESSAEPGRWSFDRFPYGREISRAIANPSMREVVISAASQVGKSELATLNPILYWASVDPAPTLLVCPTLQACRSMSLDRLDPMLRDSLNLNGRWEKEEVGPESSMFRKSLGPGCQVSIVAGLSAVGLSMRPIRYLIFEELSRLPLMAKGRSPEGDAVSLGKVRTSTFRGSTKVIYSSSPVELESCRISALYEDSTQEHYYSRCPAGHYQILALAEMNFETGACRCVTCEREYSQLEWLGNEGIWRAHSSHPFRRGFHLACWPSPLIDWRVVHAEWRQASHQAKSGDHSALRAVLGTRLGEPFVTSKEAIVEDDLVGRREVYHCELPDQTKLIVAGIDTQDTYFAYLICAFGPGRETWLLEYGQILGRPDLDTAHMYAELEERVLNRTWKRQDGTPMQVRRALQDCGGHFHGIVCRETKRRYPRLIAFQGLSSLPQGAIWTIRDDTNERARIVKSDVNKVKDLVAGLLKVEAPGRGFVHVPKEPEGGVASGFDSEFFAQLASESRQPRYRNGVKSFQWVQTRARNEALDCLVMCLSSLESLRINLDERGVGEHTPLSQQEQSAANRPAWGAQPMRRDIVYQPAGRPIGVEGESTSRPHRYGVQNRPVVW